MLDERRFSISHERSVRPTALVVVIAVHASFLLVCLPRTRPSDASRVSVWLDLDTPTARPGSVPEPVSADEPVRERADSRSAPVVAPPTLEPAAPVTDWSLSGAIAAQRIIEDQARAASYRPLGPRETAVESQEAAPSMYSTPKHKLGDAELDPLNNDIVWHSDRCYTELGKPVTPRADADFGFPRIPKCRLIGLGKKEARGDLFEHLKRDKPLPAPKSGDASPKDAKDPQEAE